MSAAAAAAIAADLAKIEKIWKAWRDVCVEDDNRQAKDTTIGAEDYKQAAVVLAKAARESQALDRQHPLLQGLQQIYDRTAPRIFGFGLFLTCFLTETKETYGVPSAARAADHLLHVMSTLPRRVQPLTIDTSC